jgi:transcriptional regulator with XRE-family HTH domain
MDREQLKQAADGIGDKVRELRQVQGLTHEQLGVLAGSNQELIQKIENGISRRPRIVEVPAWALEVNLA